jgi:hypothetical protein
MHTMCAIEHVAASFKSSTQVPMVLGDIDFTWMLLDFACPLNTFEFEIMMFVKILYYNYSFTKACYFRSMQMVDSRLGVI